MWCCKVIKLLIGLCFIGTTGERWTESFGCFAPLPAHHSLIRLLQSRCFLLFNASELKMWNVCVINLIWDCQKLLPMYAFAYISPSYRPFSIMLYYVHLLKWDDYLLIVNFLCEFILESQSKSWETCTAITKCLQVICLICWYLHIIIRIISIEDILVGGN